MARNFIYIITHFLFQCMLSIVVHKLLFLTQVNTRSTVERASLNKLKHKRAAVNITMLATLKIQAKLNIIGMCSAGESEFRSHFRDLWGFMTVNFTSSRKYSFF